MPQKRSPRLVRKVRETAKAGNAKAKDVLYPLILILRGTRKGIRRAKGWWVKTPKDRRNGILFLVALALIVVSLFPWGPVLVLAALMLLAAWAGREKEDPKKKVTQAQAKKLQAIYDGLVPYLHDPADPDQLFKHGGDFRASFDRWKFDQNDELAELELHYSRYFRDGEAEQRDKVETVIELKAGKARDYLFQWDEQGNRLVVSSRPPMPSLIPAQPFVVARGEIVIGFTDPVSARRQIPVEIDGVTRQLAPVVWRVGRRSTEPHLLALGHPGSGKSNLLRSFALQAVRAGHRVILIEGRKTGDFACFQGRRGVARVAAGLDDALDALRWLAEETERRADAISQARLAHAPVPDEVSQQLWLIVDDLVDLVDLARAADRPDPQQYLEAPLRLGRSANVTVVLSAQYAQARQFKPVQLTQLRARVGLGAIDQAGAKLLFGSTLGTGKDDELPPGRGWAKIGSAGMVRVQVPYTPDPYDEETAETDRSRVLALLAS
ncbi:FtsK/SpoIIIE domain-containing protein [Carbonactinospora thermoautotrophica]|uniref:FtsK/SpoIIIE domain-containing protein n=1 Tax=Carbonactinospora thermoautotrophica TaxID=1469144 RepID=UPI0008353911|nr:FtsK/SpoIIIE domain-containing protein [Carbonactinospora thermoautotrophica]